MYDIVLMPRKFLSTLSLRRATRQAGQQQQHHNISIHALLAESDLRPPALINLIIRISIHALLAESDLVVAILLRLTKTNFYPRSPCGERPTALADPLMCNLYFYPRSPCGERPQPGKAHKLAKLFLSTLSLRRATSGPPETRQRDAISIHALLAESDPLWQTR